MVLENSLKNGCNFLYEPCPGGKISVAIWFKGVYYYSVIEAMLLREDLADLMPMVNEANAISQELDKKVN